MNWCMEPISGPGCAPGSGPLLSLPLRRKKSNDIPAIGPGAKPARHELAEMIISNFDELKWIKASRKSRCLWQSALHP